MALPALGEHEMVKSGVAFVAFVSCVSFVLNDVVLSNCVVLLHVQSVHGACNGKVER